MVATRPVTTTAAEKSADAPANPDPGPDARDEAGPDDDGPGAPAFVAIIQSGPRPSADRADAGPASAKPSGGTGFPHAGSILAERRRPARERLHQAWFDALPASIDHLSGTPPPPEVVADAVPARDPIILGDRHRPARIALPAGRWSWWAWVAYAATIGAVTFVALYAAALVRLLLPRRQRFWAFRTRRGAARFILSTTAILLVATGAFAVVPPRPRAVPARAMAMTTGQVAPVPATSGSVASRPVTVTTGEVPVALGVPPGSLEARDLVGTTDAVVAETVGETVASIAALSLPVPEEGIAGSDTSEAPPVAVPVVSPNGGTGGRVVVADTGGRGVAFRNSPAWDDRMVPKVAFREATMLTVVESGLRGNDGAGGVTAWLRVRDGAGRTGFVPDRFVRPR